MAQQIASFKSNSGKVFENEHDAVRDDLEHWLTKIGFENAGVRTQFVTAIMADIDNGNHLLAIMGDLKRTAPPRVDTTAPAPPPQAAPKIPVPHDRALARCMGGHHCKHQMGWCTATAQPMAAPDK